MSLMIQQFYRFLAACGGSWRNTICISSNEDASAYLMAADRDGKPVIMAVEQFQQLSGEQIDPTECRSQLTASAFQDIYAQYLLWQFPEDGTDVLAALSCPSKQYDDLYQEGCIALWFAAGDFDERKGTQFHSYAISVIRNHLIDYCRHIQSRTVLTVPLEEWDAKAAQSSGGDGDLFVGQVLAYGKRTYTGVARLGVETLELKIAGYSGADIAKLYGVPPNHVGAWMSRAAKKLKKDLFPVENTGTNS